MSFFLLSYEWTLVCVIAVLESHGHDRISWCVIAGDNILVGENFVEINCKIKNEGEHWKVKYLDQTKD